MPDDGERGIVLAWNQSRTKVLVCFAAWKNGAESSMVPDAQERHFEGGGSGHGPRGALGWHPPGALPEGTFIAWYDVRDCDFDFAPNPEDRAGWCSEAYPEDGRLVRRKT